MPLCAVRVILLFLLLALLNSRISAQPAPDPRQAQPERPTLATHAYAVAPGFAELEAGWEGDRNPDETHAWSFPVLLKIGVTPRLQLGLQIPFLDPAGSTAGFGDGAIVGKFRIKQGIPLLADAALAVSLKFPTGAKPRGSGTTDAAFLFISSRSFGNAGLDVNLGYTRRSGDGTGAPKDATLATAALGWTMAGPLGFTLECYTYPHTTGPAGAPTTVAVLGGPTYRLCSACVLDLGGILRVRGSQPNAFYAGITYNLGRVFP